MKPDESIPSNELPVDRGTQGERRGIVAGRGAQSNPPGRFQPFVFEPDPEDSEPPGPGPKTHFYEDLTQTIISTNDSPDLGFDASINPYRGCEHGCSYCYARPTHEYLGFSAGLDFETRIMIKPKAAELLRAELSSPKWVPRLLALSGVTDPYQPVERKLGITRRCLEVLAEFRNPVGIVTKNHLVTRDADLLSELARWRAACVYVSITTLQSELARKMEPRTASPEHRLDAISRLANAGVPVGVLVAPIIPGLNDPEIPSILAAAAKAGAQFASYVVLRLPYGLPTLFREWLEAHYPEKVSKVMHRIEAIRGGRTNDARFGSRFKGEGIFAEQIQTLFRVSCRRESLETGRREFSVDAFRRPPGNQMDFGFSFDGSSRS